MKHDCHRESALGVFVPSPNSFLGHLCIPILELYEMLRLHFYNCFSIFACINLDQIGRIATKIQIPVPAGCVTMDVSLFSPELWG